MEKFSNQFVIDAIDDGVRLDVFLTRVTERSRSQIQKRIKAGAATVNDRIEKVPHRFLETGDVVVIGEIEGAHSHLPSPLLRKEGKEKAPMLSSPITLTILFEDNDIIVIDKPAGVLVHPAIDTPSGSPSQRRSDELTLVNALVAHDPKIALVGDQPNVRPGIVHRLDKMVSGVLVVAKTREAFVHLKQQWKARTVEKKYRALVLGQLPKTHDTIAFRIARSPEAGRMVARPASQDGRDARTDYTVTERYANATEVDILLHTGRPHQIRVHFHALGHPVVGDPLYTIRNQKRLALDRLWLHAYQLSFDHPVTGERVTFDAPVPDELITFTNTLHRL